MFFTVARSDSTLQACFLPSLAATAFCTHVFRRRLQRQRFAGLFFAVACGDSSLHTGLRLSPAANTQIKNQKSKIFKSR
jgi:hypothetical protein